MQAHARRQHCLDLRDQLYQIERGMLQYGNIFDRDTFISSTDDLWTRP